MNPKRPARASNILSFPEVGRLRGGVNLQEWPSIGALAAAQIDNLRLSRAQHSDQTADVTGLICAQDKLKSLARLFDQPGVGFADPLCAYMLGEVLIAWSKANGQCLSFREALGLATFQVEYVLLFSVNPFKGPLYGQYLDSLFTLFIWVCDDSRRLSQRLAERKGHDLH